MDIFVTYEINVYIFINIRAIITQMYANLVQGLLNHLLQIHIISRFLLYRVIASIIFIQFAVDTLNALVTKLPLANMRSNMFFVYPKFKIRSLSVSLSIMLSVTFGTSSLIINASKFYAKEKLKKHVYELERHVVCSLIFTKVCDFV